MLTQKTGMQLKLHSLTIDELVPEEHLVRQIQSKIDFDFIYDEVKDLYCANNGRPSIDPVVLVKYLLIGFLFGINSERRIEQEIRVNVAYRWFLGLDLFDSVPDHSTISQNRRRKFNGTDLFVKIFEKIVLICIENNLVDGKIILTDSTHVKANASRKSQYKILVEKSVGAFAEKLDKYEKEERERLESENKIPPKKCEKKLKPKPQILKIKSSTDPDSGFLKRGNKPQEMCYLSHNSVDAKNGIIVDVKVTPGNVNDAVPYIERIEYMTENLGLPIEKTGADSGYDIGIIHRELSKMNIEFYTPADKRTGGTPRNDLADFIYDENADTFTCPCAKTLKLNNLERAESGIYRIYKANKKDCLHCRNHNNCVAKSHSARQIRVNIFEKDFEKNRALDGTDEHIEILRQRQIRCEGNFAAQKRSHNLKQIFRRGLEAAKAHCLLSACALNIRRIIKPA